MPALAERCPPPMTPTTGSRLPWTWRKMTSFWLVSSSALPAALVSRGDPFVTLLRSIVGQQISVKAADSVWTRLLAALPEPTPPGCCRTNPQTLRACGLSARKAEYVVDLARHFANGQIHVDHWSAMSDAEIIAELTACAASACGPRRCS
jgi:DNA-3-methyladenine glycosylase II